ncbi:hypothetical protein FNF28_00816 [Cafeteria roenbergensis]|uniref:Uncharacterized protein n=1 Tax=Cafeteria roenbergensis TaxID=33653 RepID=A0A5A8E0N3_CAFRO|nr:hypothetical protein FNF28_00816 [Cafeteria roenbergensis]
MAARRRRAAANGPDPIEEARKALDSSSHVGARVDVLLEDRGLSMGSGKVSRKARAWRPSSLLPTASSAADFEGHVKVVELDSPGRRHRHINRAIKARNAEVAEEEAFLRRRLAQRIDSGAVGPDGKPLYVKKRDAARDAERDKGSSASDGTPSALGRGALTEADLDVRDPVQHSALVHLRNFRLTRTAGLTPKQVHMLQGMPGNLRGSFRARVVDRFVTRVVLLSKQHRGARAAMRARGVISKQAASHMSSARYLVESQKRFLPTSLDQIRGEVLEEMLSEIQTRKEMMPGDAEAIQARLAQIFRGTALERITRQGRERLKSKESSLSSNKQFARQLALFWGRKLRMRAMQRLEAGGLLSATSTATAHQLRSGFQEETDFERSLMHRQFASGVSRHVPVPDLSVAPAISSSGVALSHAAAVRGLTLPGRDLEDETVPTVDFVVNNARVALKMHRHGAAGGSLAAADLMRHDADDELEASRRAMRCGIGTTEAVLATPGPVPASRRNVRGASEVERKWKESQGANQTGLHAYGIERRCGISGYTCSFYFLLDFVAILSLLPEVPALYEPILGSASTSTSAATGGSTGLSAARAGRITRLGARVGRLVRMVRLFRLVKLYFLFRGRTLDKGEHQPRQSRIGIRLAQRTTRRVVVLVLLVLLVLPFFSDSSEDLTSGPAVAMLHQAASTRLQGWEVACASFTGQLGAWPPGAFVLEGESRPVRLFHLEFFPPLVNSTGDCARAENPELFSTLRNGLLDGEIQRIGLGDPARGPFTEAWFNIKPVARDDAFFSMLLTLFVSFILVAGSLQVTSDAQRLVLKPIELLADFLDRPALDSRGDITSKDNEGLFETKLLENTVKKLVTLLRLGFGPAGSVVAAKHLVAGSTAGSAAP